MSATATTTTLKLNTTRIKRADLSNVEHKEGGDISAVFSIALGDDSSKNQYPPRFSDLKKSLIKDPKAVQESWLRLKRVLKERISQVEQEKSDFIPIVDYEDLSNATSDIKELIKDKGCVVIKNIFPKEQAEIFKNDIKDYIKQNPQTVGFPKGKEVVYELYWSKPQIQARSDPRMISTLNFMNNLWHASPESEISLDTNLSYADRLRIRPAGDVSFALQEHIDGGGIERWEDPEYSNVYSKIFEGDWENFDPYDATHRVEAQMSLYPTGGACSVFRTFQGWLSMSDIAPGEGTILLAPLIRETTAYVMLRPFFNDNDELDLENPNFPGTTIGKAQEFNSISHPDLELEKLMVPIPKVSPGDAIFWSCDMIHSVDRENKGKFGTDSSVLYIPSVPLCDLNVKYCQMQRESFLGKFPPPDFPGFPAGEGERNHENSGENSGDSKYLEKVGGLNGLREFCLEPFEIKGHYSSGSKSAISKATALLFEDYS